MTPPPFDSSTIDASAKETAVLVEFRYGDALAPSFARYTDWTDDIDFGGGTFLSTPAIEVEVPPNSGVVAEKTARIVAPQDAFFDSISTGAPVSRVFVSIVEITFASTTTPVPSALFLFAGQARSATRNYQGRRKTVMVEGLSLKNQLQVPLGLPATVECGWTFTGRGCFVSPVGLATTGQVTSIASGVVLIGGLPSKAGKYWHRGWVERLGVRIGIRDWDASDPTKFVLVREPPSSWQGANVTVFPGCDKSIGTCRNRWNNEANFLGLGIAIPPYNPLAENPG